CRLGGRTRREVHGQIGLTPRLQAADRRGGERGIGLHGGIARVLIGVALTRWVQCRFLLAARGATLRRWVDGEWRAERPGNVSGRGPAHTQNGRSGIFCRPPILTPSSYAERGRGLGRMRRPGRARPLLCTTSLTAHPWILSACGARRPGAFGPKYEPPNTSPSSPWDAASC